MATKYMGVVFVFLAVLLAGGGANTTPFRQTATAEMRQRATAPPNGAIIATEISCPTNGYRGRFELVRDSSVTASTSPESRTIPGYRWIIDVMPPAAAAPPVKGFDVEVFAWGGGYGTHGQFSVDAPAEVSGTGVATRWRWTDAVRIALPGNDETLRSVEIWPNWEEALSSYPYRVHVPIPLYVGSIAFDMQEVGTSVSVTRPYIGKGTGCR